jgi:hypothetical protein
MLGSGAQADCYAKTAQDKVVVLRVRQWAVYPARAPNWTDLRVGAFLSLTKATAFDDVTGLDETIGADDRTPIAVSDRYWIGLKTANDVLPGGSENVGFIGFSNLGSDNIGSMGRSILSPSNAGTGAGTQYWWPHNGKDPNASVCIVDGRLPKARSPAGMQQHFPLDLAGGYALVLGLRLLKDNPTSNVFTLQVKTAGGNADMGYSSTPTKELLLSFLQAWPPSAQIGPVEMRVQVTGLYFYWPFHNSRLRIHSTAVVKVET